MKNTRIVKFILSLLVIAAAVFLLVSVGDESHEVSSIDTIPGARIGVQQGTTGDTFASDYEGDEEGTTITRYNKGADAVQALKQNKVDCVIIDEQPALAFVEKNKELAILDEEFAKEDYAICIAKENVLLLEQINEALKQLKEEGTLDSIVNNYIGDEAGKTPYVSPENVSRENGTLRMVTNVAFPPYEMYVDGKATGIDIDIAQAIADKLGMKLEVSDIEFDSIIVAVQSGKADIGIAGMTVTEDRLKNINFSDSYTESTQVVIVNTGEGAETTPLKDKLHQVFVEDGRWKYIRDGLIHTLIISAAAGLIGIWIGFGVAKTRVQYERDDEKDFITKILNFICRIYLTVFRGTPMMLQLLIMYYVIFAKFSIAPLWVAILAFGLNSGAYVAEAIRAGIMSIDYGQFEAGRSLGFNYNQTMKYVVMPQAIKNSLPAMLNEFIALLKESSIVGYIGLVDLTKAGDIIRSGTYEAFIPLISVGVIYLIIVMIMTYFVGRLERRLKKDAR